jgi:hypothetical protein
MRPARLNRLIITIGQERFSGRLRDDRAPLTCALFRTILPFAQQVIHARWSGEACWVPLGNLDLPVGLESATGAPEPGELLFFPGGVSETEILLPYGIARFACSAGPLAGTPFISIEDKLEGLAQLGREILWTGARDLIIKLADFS